YKQFGPFRDHVNHADHDQDHGGPTSERKRFCELVQIEIAGHFYFDKAPTKSSILSFVFVSVTHTKKSFSCPLKYFDKERPPMMPLSVRIFSKTSAAGFAARTPNPLNAGAEKGIEK